MIDVFIMKCPWISQLVVTVAIWLACRCDVAEAAAGSAEMTGASWHSSNERGADAGRKQDAMTEPQCQTVVKKVESNGRYTEEAIAPVCEEETSSKKCDFFAEALSLASSHSDFDAKRFCFNIEEARFCSENMDNLLKSEAVGDLALGECMRSKQKRPNHEAYCQKFQNMLASAVESDDLDTMRACYMMTAFSNVDNSTKELEPSPESPKVRIISTGGKELVNAGSGKPQKAVKNDIVMKPVPFADFGSGNGTMVKHGKPCGQPCPPEDKPIITVPVPADKEKQQSAQPGATNLLLKPRATVVAPDAAVAAIATQRVTPAVSNSTASVQQFQQPQTQVVQPVSQQGLQPLVPAVPTQMQAVPVPVQQQPQPQQQRGARKADDSSQSLVPQASLLCSGDRGCWPQATTKTAPPRAVLIAQSPPAVVVAANVVTAAPAQPTGTMAVQAAPVQVAPVAALPAVQTHTATVATAAISQPTPPARAATATQPVQQVLPAAPVVVQQALVASKTLQQVAPQPVAQRPIVAAVAMTSAPTPVRPVTQQALPATAVVVQQASVAAKVVQAVPQPAAQHLATVAVPMVSVAAPIRPVAQQALPAAAIVVQASVASKTAQVVTQPLPPHPAAAVVAVPIAATPARPVAQPAAAIVVQASVASKTVQAVPQPVVAHPAAPVVAPIASAATPARPAVQQATAGSVANASTATQPVVANNASAIQPHSRVAPSAVPVAPASSVAQITAPPAAVNGTTVVQEPASAAVGNSSASPTSANASATMVGKGIAKNGTMLEKVSIIRQTVPLTPVSGHLRSGAAAAASNAASTNAGGRRKRAGLTQANQTMVHAATSVAKVEETQGRARSKETDKENKEKEKDDSKYSGFLSKFVT